MSGGTCALSIIGQKPTGEHQLAPALVQNEMKERATDLLEVRHVPESIQFHGRLVLPQLTAPCLIQLPQVHLQAGTAMGRYLPCYLRL